MTPFRKPLLASCLLTASALALSACSTIQPDYPTRPATSQSQTVKGAGGYKVGKPYQVRGQWYYPAEQPDYDETGLASWYGDAFNGKPTANGETFDMHAVSAAHKTLPLPSLVEVTNLENGRSLQLRVNDRGPFVDGRIIDLSKAAAEELGILRSGLAKVRVRYVGRADIPGQGPVTIARAAPVLPVIGTAAIAAEPAATSQLATAPATIIQTELAPPSEVASSSLPMAQTPPAPPAYQVQAGAFSDRVNAERVATQLADAGLVEIQPMERNGAMLYRVMVRDIAGQAEAGAVRDRVVSIGLADARIINPF